MKHLVVIASLACAAALGCKGKEESGSASAGSTAASAPDWSHVREARFVAQPGWVEQKPSSAMRVAQYSLPREAGDPEDGELAVFHFQGSGGSAQDNLDRWIAQMAQPDGKPSKDVAVTNVRKVGPFLLTEIALSGTYVAETRPGSGERYDKPGFELFAAVIEGPGGPYYAKAVGPAKTMDHWRPSWNAFLSALVP